MKKFNLKNAFTAAGIAVFAGVLTIGVNAAIGVSSPTEDPKDAALVSPTFNGVDIQGEVKNTSTSNKGLIRINDHAQVIGDFGVNGNMFAQKNITLGYPLGGGDLATDWEKTGTLEVYNKIIHPDITKPLVLADDVKVSGVLDVAGAIKNTEGGILQIDALGGIDINSQIRNDTVAGTPVYFNDANGVAIKAGNLDIQAGGLKNSTENNGGSVIIDDNVSTSGTITSGGALVSNGDLSIGTQDKNKKFLFHTRTNASGDFLQITNDKADGSWDWNNGIVLKRGGNVGIGTKSPNAKFTVNGKVTANEIGTITNNESNYIKFTSGGWRTGVTKTLTCPNNAKVLSCWWEDWATDLDTVNMKHSSFSGSTCLYDFDHNGDVKINFYQTCWDPKN